MAKYVTDSEFKRLVRVCLDENMSSEQLTALQDIDTLSLDELIESKAEDAALSVVRVAPVEKLGDVAQSLEGVLEISGKAPYKGHITLPLDYERLVRFKMSSWQYGVFMAQSPDTPQYIHANSEFNVYGTKDRPAVFLTPSTEGGSDLFLEFYCAGSTSDSLDGCLYVAKPKKESTQEESSGDDSGQSGSGDSGSGGTDEGGDVLVDSITLNYQDLLLEIGDTFELVAVVSPLNAEQSVSWESDNESVATVVNGVVTAVSVGTCNITCSANDESEETAQCAVTVTEHNDDIGGGDNTGDDDDTGDDDNSGSGNSNAGISGYTEGVDYVDLGLPSGTLWATRNVGAENPEDYGDKFKWGETDALVGIYNGSTHKYYADTSGYGRATKYCTRGALGYDGFVDGKTELEAEDDAAIQNEGGLWRMPSKEQIEELIANTTLEYTRLNGINGFLMRSNEDNSKTIFFPTAGYYFSGDNDLHTGVGFYWSRDMDASGYLNLPYYLWLNIVQGVAKIEIESAGRTNCGSVRPIFVPKLPQGRKPVRIDSDGSTTSGSGTGSGTGTGTSGTTSSSQWKMLLGDNLLRPTIYYAAYLTALAIKDDSAAEKLLGIAKDLLGINV